MGGEATGSSAAGRNDRLASAPERCAGASEGREFIYTQADFERIRKMIYARAGISLGEHKHDMVYSRLARRLRARGDRRFADYIARLEAGDSLEWEQFVNALTTNLTSFFREGHHFEILAEQLRQRRDPHPVNIWCCAASTGEEAYSIAIAASEALGGWSSPVSVLASDLDTSVLRHGAEGLYAADRVASLSPARLARHFTAEEGAGPRGFRVRPELQRFVKFRRINLLEPMWPVASGLDAIFCRNVMIYFDKATQYQILKRFVPLLRPDGRLYAGHSESFLHAADLFRPLGRTVYARADARG